jgi:hypothetical protein
VFDFFFLDFFIFIHYQNSFHMSHYNDCSSTLVRFYQVGN